jgi:hypothetical protein
MLAPRIRRSPGFLDRALCAICLSEVGKHRSSRGDGINPYGPVVIDGNGNLYGIAELGGNLNDCYQEFEQGCGTVWEITPRCGDWRHRPGRRSLSFDAGVASQELAT